MGTIQQLPHNLDAEEAVLGSIFIDPFMLNHVVAIVKPEMFFVSKHGTIFRILLDMQADRVSIDFTTLCDALSRVDQLDAIGGPAYLSHLIGTVVTALHAQDYARIVRENWVRRQKIAACGEVARLAWDASMDIDTLASESIRLMMDGTTLENRAQPAKRIAQELLAEIEFYVDNPIGRDEVRGLATGIRGVDNALGGLEDGTLILLAARPGMGKSSLAGQIAENVSMRGKKVLYHSLEMNRKQVLRRLACGRSHSNWLRVRQGQIGEEELTRLMYHVGEIAKLPIVIDDTPGITSAQLRASVAMHSIDGLALVVVDHIGLMSDSDSNEVRRLHTISWACKQIAKDFRVPVIGVHQLNRSVEARDNKRPVVTDLRDSGNLEQNADIVLMLYRERHYNPSSPDKTAEIIVRKNREGECNAVAKMVFVEECTRFEPLAIREVDFGNG